MRKLETLLKTIDNAEKEIHKNYSDMDIYNAYVKLLKNGHYFKIGTSVQEIISCAYDNVFVDLQEELREKGIEYFETDEKSIEELIEMKKEIDKKC